MSEPKQDWKDDARPARGGWAPGEHLNRCGCGDHFIGDKRASQCADCAYTAEDISEPAEERGDYIKCPKCGHEDRDTCDYPSDEDFDWQCGECDTPLMVSGYTRTIYTTKLQ